MRNYRLYFFEFFFALLIIFTHLNFPAGELYLDSFGRITVIFFFILSGYFYTRTLNKEDFSYKSTLKRCLRLFLMAVSIIIVYCAVFIPIKWVELGAPKMFSENFNWTNIVYFFDHYIPKLSFLWFIFALILCYLLYPLLYKVRWFKENKYSIIVPLIILLSIYIYRIFCNQYDWGFFSSYQATRNFLLTGLPCFLISSYIYHREKEIKRINPKAFYLSIICLLGLTMVEAFYHDVTSGKPNEFYISSLAIAILTFIYCIQNHEVRFGKWLDKVFGSTGPTIIYLYHMFFAQLLYVFYNIPWGVMLIILCADICAISLALVYNFFKTKYLKRKQSI